MKNFFLAIMPTEPKCKACNKPAPYACKPGPKTKWATERPTMSARIQSNKCENLTLHDWMTVLGFIDTHPTMSQAAVVEHFKSKADGALVFTQSSLSRKLQDQECLEARVQSNPNALSSKRPHVVTQPDVE
jgi:hypothetical protein